MKDTLKNIFFKIWYWYISTIDKNAEVIFMNYGYSNNSHKIDLNPEDEKNRYSAQLYNLVATGVEISDKNILEIGCGRGGGLSYVNKYLKPSSVTGVDLNKKAIEFCKKHYPKNNAIFLQGNAQKLPFNDASFDAVLNVESSHRYPQIEMFLAEVYRVLKVDGYFLFTDFRKNTEIERLKEQIIEAKFEFIKDENITQNVVEALKLATPARKELIDRIIPKFLNELGNNFAATVGSPTYNKFSSREFEYVFYVLKK
ncbi:MAG: class I SAM-dependent methyltransferase [Salinivirgaceae bacterium]|nr:class I SAM-dependent methyltransferase [Salinivirgaceae bacterium]